MFFELVYTFYKPLCSEFSKLFAHPPLPPDSNKLAIGNVFLLFFYQFFLISFKFFPPKTTLEHRTRRSFWANNGSATVCVRRPSEMLTYAQGSPWRLARSQMAILPKVKKRVCDLFVMTTLLSPHHFTPLLTITTLLHPAIRSRASSSSRSRRWVKGWEGLEGLSTHLNLSW